jgi:hypothetical protein
MKAGQGIVTSRILTLLALCGLIMSTALARAATQPIYDPQADARQDIAAAIAQASKTGRNVVLIFGANW